ncbi:helicase C-terminal domain-containing protein [Enterococcus durans]|uniref:helicase C-terminal domain-containing protein n=1 Tax=Enterococcus durans TaxID=53345 RepID=UPI00288D6F66|nr:helicase C-terminal domain-containing protein [Enterococcus durans]MDT2835847.1 helicase C-terminal domain-containing protein [Enterococcus durans]
MKQSKISVRNLVEFILRRGSIDNRKKSNHTALEGAKIHRKLQKEAGETYEKEVFLKTTVELDDVQLTIEGRADGIFQKDGLYYIDEIKTSEPRFEDLEQEQVDLFFHQARVYAYIYCHKQELTEINLQLTYFQTTEEQITRKTEYQTIEQLDEFFKKLIADYEEWLIFRENWRTVRNTSLMALKFPHDNYRKGQRELAVAAYKTIKTKQKLFAEAPTGTGKTVSTLFPTLKAIGEESGERVFYLTAKTITRQVAEDAMVAFNDAGAEAKSVTLTAKDKICFLDETTCNPDQCPYANGYYDRINEGLWDLLNHENQITREVIETYAKKHTLCPFELSLDVSLWCDVIIGDYNYLFDPTVYLRRFFEEEKNEDNIFLIDEAHNLVNRSREMYSAELSYRGAKNVYTIVPKEFKKLRRRINKLLKEFDKIQELSNEDGWDYHHQKAPAESLITAGYQLSEVIQEWLAEYPEHAIQETILPFYFDLLHFLKISEFYDDHYETTVKKTYHDFVIKEFCIDPSLFLEQSLDKGRSSLLFSASFSPLSYYQETLGGKESLAYRLPSPFPEENQQVLIANYIETTYRKREESSPRLVETINQFISGKKGNYFVFFPSYQYLDQTATAFKERYPEVRLLIQETVMNETERETFLANFKIEPAETLVAFCVLGGIFSEGIDLKGTRLIGSMIVGVGLPQMNHEQELIKEYYNEKDNLGFAYAYQLPGMNKVLQAAGRVIRDTTDEGIVVLADRRFATRNYRQLFPHHWHGAKNVNNVNELSSEIHRFWTTRKD